MNTAQALEYLLEDGGATPGSQYGSTGAFCAPVAVAVADILAAMNDEEIDRENLDWIMGLVVNSHEDPGYILWSYGAEYGYKVEDYLEESQIEDLETSYNEENER